MASKRLAHEGSREGPQVNPSLSDEQEQARDRVIRWLSADDGPQVFYLAGPAGCGKTVLVQTLPGVDYFCAPTGKAAHVLRRKGVAQAMTLHRLLYTPSDSVSDRLQELLLQYAEASEEDRVALREKIRDEKRNLGPSFSLNGESDARGKVVAVDEASMVGGKVLDDLLSVARKVILVGDPYQLPPVRDASILGTRYHPDVTLRTIHRQAMESPVLALATAVRIHGSEALSPGPRVACRETSGPAGRVRVYSHPSEAPREIYTGNDALLVYRNATRQAFNSRFRELLGRKSPVPEVGEKMVVLRNDYDSGVWNGGVYTSVAVKGGLIDLQDEDGFYPDVPWALGLPSEVERGVVPLDYGYALTAHKAQGSEWDSVTVYAQTTDPRWLYTALTRARTNCDVILAA